MCRGEPCNDNSPVRADPTAVAHDRGDWYGACALVVVMTLLLAAMLAS